MKISPIPSFGPIVLPSSRVASRSKHHGTRIQLAISDVVAKAGGDLDRFKYYYNKKKKGFREALEYSLSRSYHQWTTEQLKLVVALRDEGISYSAIASHMNQVYDCNVFNAGTCKSGYNRAMLRLWA